MESLHWPFEENALHTITPPQPFWRREKIAFYFYRSCQQKERLSGPSKLNLFSSEKMQSPLFSSLHVTCYSAHSTRISWWFWFISCWMSVLRKSKNAHWCKISWTSWTLTGRLSLLRTLRAYYPVEISMRTIARCCLSFSSGFRPLLLNLLSSSGLSRTLWTVRSLTEHFWLYTWVGHVDQEGP